MAGCQEAIHGISYRYGSMRFKAVTLAESATALWRSRRVLLVGFLVRMWLLKALALTNLPVPVFLKRFAAPRFVFIFGI